MPLFRATLCTECLASTLERNINKSFVFLCQKQQEETPNSNKEDLVPTAMPEFFDYSCLWHADGWEGEAKKPNTQVQLHTMAVC